MEILSVGFNVIPAVVNNEAYYDKCVIFTCFNEINGIAIILLNLQASCVSQISHNVGKGSL